jgi:acetyltransferase
MGIIDVSEGVKYLQSNGYPVYRFPENAAKSFAALYNFSKWVNRERLPEFDFQYDKEKATTLIAGCLAANKTRLGELDGLKLLKAYGFNVLPTELATSDSEAAKIASAMGFPVVMKIVSAQILHKSDAGGVVVGVKSEEEAKTTFRKIMDNAGKYDPKAVIDGVLIQQMAQPGEEVILGMNRTALGPLIMFGLGGIFVELFKDVIFGLAPLCHNDTVRMINAIRGHKLLEGFRGRPKADVEEIEKLLIRLSNLVVDHPEIEELDINPLLVHPVGKGATVADCRMILKAKGV